MFRREGVKSPSAYPEVPLCTRTTPAGLRHPPRSDASRAVCGPSAVAMPRLGPGRRGGGDIGARRDQPGDGHCHGLVDSSPIVCLTGRSRPNSSAPMPSGNRHHRHHLPITKHNYLVTDVDSWPRPSTGLLHRPGGPGPSSCSTKDGQKATANMFPPKAGASRHRPTGEETLVSHGPPHQSTQRPMILAGHGVLMSGYECPKGLCRDADAVGLTLLSRAASQSRTPRPGYDGNAAKPSSTRQSRADLILAFGMRR